MPVRFIVSSAPALTKARLDDEVSDDGIIDR